MSRISTLESTSITTIRTPENWELFSTAPKLASSQLSSLMLFSQNRTLSLFSIITNMKLQEDPICSQDPPIFKEIQSHMKNGKSRTETLTVLHQPALHHASEQKNVSSNMEMSIKEDVSTVLQESSLTEEYALEVVEKIKYISEHWQGEECHVNA